MKNLNIVGERDRALPQLSKRVEIMELFNQIINAIDSNQRQGDASQIDSNLNTMQ